MKNLYLITTKGLGDYYVIANDPTEAQDSLIKIFNAQNYGNSKNRKIINIKWLSESFYSDLLDKSKPFLSNKDNRLLIVEYWLQ